MLVRTLGSEGGWISWGYHIDWRKERVLTKTRAPKRVDCENPTLVGEENETPFIRVWKHFPSRRVLNT